MLSKRADAFTDVSTEGSEDRRARLEAATRLLDEQARLLMRTEAPSEGPGEAHHSPHNPHRRPLSSAARRLVRAHRRLEAPDEED